jgi:peptide/nickel transport system substrate-binding protein
MRRRFTALPIVVALVAAACSATPSPSSSPGQSVAATGTPVASPTVVTGGTITWGKPAELLEFDPTTSLNGVSWQLFYLVYETLTEMGPNLDIQPGVAEKWDNPSPTEYDFHLRAGETFSNGRAMTADDVVGTFQRLLDPKTAAFWAAQLPVKTVSKVDDSTVKFELTKPFTPFLAALANASASILPMKELNDKSFDVTKEMLGSGPFMVKEHKQDESWTFERNPHYWRSGFPVVDTVQVKIITDDNARIAALRDGSIDIALFENVDAPQLLKDVANVTTVVQKTTDYYRIDVNEIWDQAKTLDQGVRFAISEAIDRGQIRDVALGGLGEPTAATPPGFPDSCDVSAVPSSAHNLEDAKAKLAAANASNLKFQLIASPVFPTFPLIAQVIQQNLAAVGVTADIAQLEVGDWEKRVFSDNPSQMDAALSYFAGYGDAGMVPAWWDPVASGWDKGFLKPNDQVDALITQSQALAAGSAERKSVLQQLCNLVDQDSGIIPLVTRPIIVAYRSDQLNANVQPVEGYVDPLRFIQEYSKVSP